MGGSAPKIGGKVRPERTFKMVHDDPVRTQCGVHSRSSSREGTVKASTTMRTL